MAKKLRLAPTPSGYLHLGNGVNFVLNWLEARKAPAGTLLLRIDDMDSDRKRPEYVQDIFETLEWLGIDWDEGPRNAADFESNWSQHRRMDWYEEALDLLKTNGLVYACKKSRSDLAPFGGNYPVDFRNQGLSLDDPDVAWRIRTPENFPMPDFVVRRRDGLPAYQITSLVDDLHFKITCIIRGEDLIASTIAQRYLAAHLGSYAAAFEKVEIRHHPLIRNESGEKLSKSAGANALRSWRETERSPAEVFEAARNLIE